MTTEVVKPAARQRWHVQIKGERKVRTITIAEVTEKTVMFYNAGPGPSKKSERFLLEDVNFIERD